MRKPIVAIIGRPNVGKSTLVNRIVGSRQAIVDDLPGVTRDRAYYDAEWLNHYFTLVDTGGLMPGEEELFAPKVNEQVLVALEEADVVLVVMDGQAGITPWDETLAKWTRNLEKPVILVVNKIDKREQHGQVAEFYALGLGDPIGVSAMHGSGGVGDLLDKVLEAFKTLDESYISTLETLGDSLRIAFVGRPNVGKSSMVNRLIGEERTIVSDIPGTTRDAIDTEIIRDGKTYTLVDTAGIRKKSKVSFGVELFSVDRALRAVKRADVTVLVLDANEGVTDQDKRIVETSNEYGKGLIITYNKWDTVEKKDTKSQKGIEQKIALDLPHARFAPIVLTSAKTGQRVEKILELAEFVYENNHRRISTSVLNDLLQDATNRTPPPPVKNKTLKIYYGTQVDVAPPTFLLFVNSDTLLKETYRRYLENHLRANIEFTGTPLVVAFRNKPEKALRK